MKIAKSQRAQDDLIGIWTWVYTESSETAANNLLDQIESRLVALATFPLIGVSRENLRPGFRMLAVGEYLILYRVLEKEIEVVRVIDGRRDLPNALD